MEAAALCPSLSHPQHLQEDRDGLHTTAELLQVRVQSLMHILSMQEEELARKVGPCPRPRFPQHLSVGGRGCCAARTCRDLSFLEGVFSLCLLLLGQDRRNRKHLLPLLPRSPHFPHSSTLQVQPSDSLEPEFTRKCQSLLKGWREKVFALMVQLKAQELEHRGCKEHLKGQVTWCPLSSQLLAAYIWGDIYSTNIYCVVTTCWEHSPEQ